MYRCIFVLVQFLLTNPTNVFDFLILFFNFIFILFWGGGGLGGWVCVTDEQTFFKIISNTRKLIQAIDTTHKQDILMICN